MDKIAIFAPDSKLFPTDWTDYICSETVGIYKEIGEPDATISINIDDNYVIELFVKKEA